MSAIKTKQPATVYIKFTGESPKKFMLTNSKGEVYFFRYLDGKTPRIKFNLVHPDSYKGNVNFEIVKVVPIEIPDMLPELPDYDRDRLKDFVIIDNPDLAAPARVFTEEGVIERGRDFYKHAKPLRVFILLHEIGHFFYGVNDLDYVKASRMNKKDGEAYLNQRRQQGEEKADTFALIHYLKMGYNRSMAYYALENILSKSSGNTERLKKLLHNIQKTQSNVL